MNISLSHPTDRPNFSLLSLGDGLDIYFSYRTPIAYRVDWSGWVVRENVWGPTTGKHLRYVDDGDKASRIPGAQFEAQLGAILERLRMVPA